MGVVIGIVIGMAAAGAAAVWALTKIGKGFEHNI